LQNFTGADEKTAIIQLNALLSEQFRSIAVAQNFLEEGTSDEQALAQTSWKPGRLFIMKKTAGRFAQKKVLDFLKKLEHLDEELKTSSTPPRVLLDLIVAQLF
jgi:DNA polymerase III delta subunit